MSTTSFASTYVLASKVRSKLTRQAADPKSSLRSLVLQANMLDDLMEHISSTSKQQNKTVSFAQPETGKTMAAPVVYNHGPNVTEYEIDSDSDSDFDSDSEYESDSDSESDSESDYEDYIRSVESTHDGDDLLYLSSDEEDEEDDVAHLHFSRCRHVPKISLANDHPLSVIAEENEDILPELSHSVSSSEEESDDYIQSPSYIISSYHQNKSSDSLMPKDMDNVDNKVPFEFHHRRSDAIQSMESVF